MNLKTGIFAGIVIVFLTATTTFGEDCATAIASFDQKLAETNVSNEILFEVQYIRNQADQSCQAGQVKEALAFIAQAEALIDAK